MRINPLKTKLTNHQSCPGIWLAIPSAHSTRLLTHFAVDWLVVDAEHTPLDNATLFQMVSTIADANGPVPLVRIAQSSSENIKQALDAGAMGVIAPMINTAAEAAQVVAWAKFPPLGQRSFGSAYTPRMFGASNAEYIQIARDQTLVMVQIESQTALPNLDSIFSTPGVDLAFVGPVDLSISLGLDPIPENTNPILLDAIQLILNAAQKHKMPLGIYCSNGQAASMRIQQGFQFVNVTSDVNAMLQGAAIALNFIPAK
jgi:4-hydroxy-2-oxoheptanedioate aldolase